MEKSLIPTGIVKLFFHYKNKPVHRIKGNKFTLRWIALATAVLATLTVYELQTSRFQAFFLNQTAKGMTFWMEPGPSPSIRFPKTGPYDKRLGYTLLPAFIDRLTANGYEIKSQARFSENLTEITDRGYFTTFHEKTQSGLQILDQNSNILFASHYPERIYNKFDNIPEVIVKSLLFIENKELLNSQLPYLNPAVEWDRLAKAVMFKGRHLVVRDERVPGGSTLATQMEKYRHSPDGLTSSIHEKYRQMTSAALRAYLNGKETTESRSRIVLDYINSIPLGAVPGYGQVNGIGDGLYAWYQADFNSINNCLAKSPEAHAAKSKLTEWARAYKQVLSLFLAQRRPTYYLLEKPDALETKTNSYIRLLADNGIISSQERNAALLTKLTVKQYMPVSRRSSFVDRKAANAIRPKLLSLLKVPSLYDLDLLDLSVTNSLDYRSQKEVTDTLSKLREPEFTKAAGLQGGHLLGNRNPANVIYSFTLYEKTPGANLLRIQADNFDQPFNINEGVKLELGSSAKLRTLITYLEIMAALHKRYSGLPKEQLRTIHIPEADQLSKWVIDYLSNSGDISLQATLTAAMKRHYSASPAESFFTGGGVHTFSNFDNKYDKRVISVQEAFHNSVNLVFIRMMRDIVHHYIFRRPGVEHLLNDIDAPGRQAYLERFADREGKIFLRRFYRKYQAPETYPVTDRGAKSHIHPLELWTAAYMYNHPDTSLSELIKVSENELREVYTWLFKTPWKNAQDIRIKTILELEAFSEIHRAWKNLRYPFDSLVPSYATAIGSSADRPEALSELAGIILNNGMWYPSRRIQELHFAKDTPYETILRQQPAQGERVLLPEVADAIKEAMIGVVENGTAHSIHRAFTEADGTPIVIGGKTGTGDNRHEIYGPGRRLIRSEAINRTAVFVFFLGDRFFGTITAYVGGPEADNYTFTSSLPVQVLKILAPKLMPLAQHT